MVSTRFLPLRALSLTVLALPVGAVASDDLFFSDLPIVASISRLPQRQVDAPTAVTVIDRETIRASGARALSDVMRLVPGFQTFASSDVVARVTYHGVTDQDYSPRVQVLVDGRSLHSPLFRDGMNWALVPVALEDIERIEVVRGSNTTSYGTNAFLGVINIVTVDPALVRGVAVSTNVGNQGVRDVTLRTGFQLRESHDVRLTVQELRDDGLDHDSYTLKGFQDWRDQNRTRLVDLRSNFQIDRQDSLELHLGQVDGRRLIGRLGDGGQPRPSNPLRDIDERSTWLQLRWLRAISDTSDFSLRYTHSVDEADGRFTDPSLPPGYQVVNEQGGRGKRHALEAVSTFLPFDDLRMVWGGSVRYDTLDADTRLNGNNVSRSIRRMFSNLEWKPSGWLTSNFGVSYEDDSLAGGHWAPRGSFSFHLSPENTIRLGYARAWRTAGTLDYKAWHLTGPTTAEWVGNRRLPAEQLDTWELAYLGNWRDLRLSLDVRAFHEKLRDRHIALIRTGEAPPGITNKPYTVEALQDLSTRGYELQARWQPIDGTRLTVGYADITIDSDTTDRGKQLLLPGSPSNFLRSFSSYEWLAEESAPRRSTSVMLTQALPHALLFSVVYYKVDDIKWTRNTFTEGYERIDARLAYPFRFASYSGELAYTMQSLNGAHSEQREERVVDRRHWATLKLDF